MNTLGVWLNLFLLLLFGSMVAVAFQYPPEASLAPIVVGIPGMTLCLVQLALDLASLRRGPFAALGFRAAPKPGRPEEYEKELAEVDRETVRRELAIWGYFVTFLAGLLAFGFYTAVPAMLFVYLRLQARVRWTSALIAGVGATAVMFFVFGAVFRFTLFPGIVTPIALNALGL